MPKIAFICTGNICRSPFAEHLLRNLAPKGWNLEVVSYGIMTTDGQEVSDTGSIVALEEGLDVSSHRSRALRPSELRDCDLIFTMTKAQKFHLELAMPDIRDRIFCLTEFGREGKRVQDVDDPMGGDLSVYRKCFKRIREEIERTLPLLGSHFGLR